MKAASTSARAGFVNRTHLDQQQLDISSLNLESKEEVAFEDEPLPKASIAREKLLEEARRSFEDPSRKKAVSLVVIGPF